MITGSCSWGRSTLGTLCSGRLQPYIEQTFCKPFSSTDQECNCSFCGALRFISHMLHYMLVLVWGEDPAVHGRRRVLFVPIVVSQTMRAAKVAIWFAQRSVPTNISD